MRPLEPQPSNSLRYYAVGVLCVAVLLGGYIMQLNDKADRQREEAAERLALCRQVERVASVAVSGSLELRDSCKQLSEQSISRGAPN